MRRLGRTGALVAVAVTVFALCGCGIAIQTSAKPIKVPKNLFLVPKVPRAPAHHGDAIDVYFLSNDHLVPTTRYLAPGRLSESTELQDALNALSLGPTTSELRLGVTTALSEFPPAQFTVLGSVKKGVAAVVLDSTFGNLDATEQYECDGQVVYTLTQFPGVQSVSFVFGGVKQAVLPGGAVVFDENVQRHDYRAIRPLASASGV